MKFPYETTLRSSLRPAQFVEALKCALERQQFQPFSVWPTAKGLRVEIRAIRRRRSGCCIYLQLEETHENLLIRYTVVPHWLELAAKAVIVALCLLAGISDGFQFSGAVWNGPIYAGAIIFFLVSAGEFYTHFRHKKVDLVFKESARQNLI